MNNANANRKQNGVCVEKVQKSNKSIYAMAIVLIFIIIVSSITVFAAADQIGYRFYYKQMVDFQKQIYDFILSAPHETAEYTIDICEDLTLYSDEEIHKRVSDAECACDLDNPEQTSWLEGAWCISINRSANQITLGISRYEFFDEEDSQKIDYILDGIESNADPSWDCYTKAYFIASTISSCMKYDLGTYLYEVNSKANEDKQHITGVLNGVAVCEGYTELFKALADRLELPCVEVGSKGHAFVHIMMEDGKWYGQDPQGELRLEGSSMYQGELYENGYENIYEIYDGLYNYLVQPQRTEKDYSIREMKETPTVPDVFLIRKELNMNSGEPLFIYSVNEDGMTCTITGYKGKQQGDLIIPETIDGFEVNAIGNSAFAFCSYFDGCLYIPDTVKSIGTGAFAYCYGLKGDIILPKALQILGDSAFFSCNGFDGSIVFSDGLKNIQSSAFSKCSQLTGDLLLPDSIENIAKNAFHECEGLNGIVHIPAGMDSWNADIINSCFNLSSFDVSESDPRFSVIDGILYSKDTTELIQCIKGYKGDVVIPDGVTRVAPQAFYQCLNITSVQLPNTLREIGDYAFANMYNMIECDLVIPSSVETIGKCAFWNSNYAGTFYYPLIDNVGFGAFGGNQNIKRIIIPDGVTNIPIACFTCAQIKEAIIPESVICIGADAFDSAYDMLIIGTPSSYAETYANANQDKRFKFVSYSEGILQDVYQVYLDVNGFRFPKCIELTSQWISTNKPVEYTSWTISEPAWAEIEDGIITAKDSGCVIVEGKTDDGITTTWQVNCSIHPESIIAEAERTELYVGQETYVYVSYIPVFTWVFDQEGVRNYTSITFESSDPSTVEVDGDMIKAKQLGTVTITARNAVGMESTIDISVVEKSQLIPNLDDLSVMELPSSLKIIEEEAFSNLNCQAIIIHDGCLTIGEHAFEGCYDLQYVRIPSSIRSYPQNAFEDCSSELLIDWQ